MGEINGQPRQTMTKAVESPFVEEVKQLHEGHQLILARQKTAAGADRKALLRARKVGEVLIRVRDALAPKRQWSAWLDNPELGFGPETARGYVRIAENWELVKDCTSIHGALALIQGVKNSDSGYNGGAPVILPGGEDIGAGPKAPTPAESAARRAKNTSRLTRPEKWEEALHRVIDKGPRAWKKHSWAEVLRALGKKGRKEFHSKVLDHLDPYLDALKEFHDEED